MPRHSPLPGFASSTTGMNTTFIPWSLARLTSFSMCSDEGTRRESMKIALDEAFSW